MKTVFNHERSSVPTSMFDNEGKMRIVTTKSTLKTKLQVTVSQRLVKKSEGQILHGCVILWLNQGTEERGEKGGKPGYSSDDCASFEYYNGKCRLSEFVDGATRLSDGVGGVDGIDSFLPSLLLFIVKL